MRRLFSILIFLIASVLLGLAALKYNQGWVLVIAPPWTIQSPLWFAVLCVLGLVLIGIVLVSSIRSLQFAWYRFCTWLRFRKGKGSYSKTQHGFLFFLEGRFKKAEALLMRGALDSPLPVINHLCAAQAAHALKKFSARDLYLQQACKEAPEAHLAIAITEAKMKLSADDLKPAIAFLTTKLERYRKQPELLTLLYTALERDQQHQTLLTYLPIFKRIGILDHSEASQLELNCYRHQFNSLKHDVSEMKIVWKNAPSSIRSHSDILFAYASALFHDPQHHAEIEKLIRQHLKEHYDSHLVALYSRLNAMSVQRQLVILGAWLKQHGAHAALLMALGHACTHAKLWGRAKEYFAASLEKWRSEAYPHLFFLYLQTLREYCSLLENLGEHDQARLLYGAELDKILEKNYTSSQNTEVLHGFTPCLTIS